MFETFRATEFHLEGFSGAQKIKELQCLILPGYQRVHLVLYWGKGPIGFSALSFLFWGVIVQRLSLYCFILFSETPRFSGAYQLPLYAPTDWHWFSKAKFPWDYAAFINFNICDKLVIFHFSSSILPGCWAH